MADTWRRVCFFFLASMPFEKVVESGHLQGMLPAAGTFIKCGIEINVFRWKEAHYEENAPTHNTLGRTT